MKHNIYFDGRVQSLGVNTKEGFATLGVITPGKYTFSANFTEHVLIISGSLRVKFPGLDWNDFRENDVYVVPSGSSFEVEASSDVAYLCRYK